MKPSDKPKVDLNDFFCTLPFEYAEFHGQGNFSRQHVCCPDWNNINIYRSENLIDNWNSWNAKALREGQLNGQFTGCNAVSCPALNTLVNTGKPILSIRPKSEFDPKKYSNYSPKRIKISSDNACNLKCPTCRSELKPNTKERTVRTKSLLDSIKKYYGPTLEEIFTSGGGDPFYSTPMREWLQEMSVESFPNLKNVLIHTNGILFTPKIWETMKNIHPFVKYVEISIDAATKDTYENKVRLNGKWDVLLQNLNFIKTIETIQEMQFDYVVQTVNYKEMKPFVDMIYNIFKDSKFKFRINFQKVWPWPTIKPDDYKEMCVWEKSHELYDDFLTEINSLEKYNWVHHNLHEHIND